MTSPVWDRPEVALIRHMGGRIYARVGAHKWTELPTWGQVLVTEDLVAQQHQALAVFVSRPDDDEQVRPGVDEIAEQIRGPWFDERRFSAEAIAACVDALYASQPTVSEVKSEAWAEAVADLATALDEFKQAFPEATEQAKGVERAGNFLIRHFGLDEWLRVRTDPANAQMTPSEDSPRGRTPRRS